MVGPVRLTPTEGPPHRGLSLDSRYANPNWRTNVNAEERKQRLAEIRARQEAKNLPPSGLSAELIASLFDAPSDAPDSKRHPHGRE